MLATVTALPLFLGGAATATAAPGDGPGPAGHVAEADLVPGYPLPPTQPYQEITPDQGAYPPVDGSDDWSGAPGAPERPADGGDLDPRPGQQQPGQQPNGPNPDTPSPDTPSPDAERPGEQQRGHQQSRTPGAEFAAPSALIEYVPPGEEVREDEPRPKLPRCSKRTGPYQRFVERYLGLTVDGVQSPADCTAIQQYQTKVGIYPNSGFAGPVTWKVMTLKWARAHPEQLRGCPRTQGTVACLDLSRQIMWVMNGGTMIYRPVPLRSGKPGYLTRTGWHRVFKRVRHEHSRLYDAPMPFSQYFNGGQAIHGVYDDIYTGNGSHGCVNLRYEDAQRLWKILRQGDRVYIWGRKPNR